jgi:hypothetical protein
MRDDELTGAIWDRIRAIRAAIKGSEKPLTLAHDRAPADLRHLLKYAAELSHAEDPMIFDYWDAMDSVTREEVMLAIDGSYDRLCDLACALTGDSSLEEGALADLTRFYEYVSEKWTPLPRGHS